MSQEDNITQQWKAPPKRGVVVIEKIETEADRQIQLQLKRQLNTDVNLQDELSKKKRFHAPSILDPGHCSTAGERTLAEFSKLTNQQLEVQDLRDCGLTIEEVNFKLQNENNKSGYGAHSSFTDSKKVDIDKKITVAMERREKTDSVSNTRHMSRHQLDFERSITHNEDKVRSLQHLTSQHSNQSDDPNDPINKLDDIWKDISYKQMKTKQIVQRRSLHHLSTPGDDITEGIMSAKKMNKTGKHDCERECYSGKPCTWQMTGPANRVVCKKGNKYCLSGNVISVVKKDTVKPLQGDVTNIPDHVITRYRLSLDEIKQLPRFADYQKGEPSKKLFVKNLSAKVTEEDLVSLFNRFQVSSEAQIEYRLLTGRMKGQAFVTFHDIEQATTALDFINGYDFKGKPIIIQYGRTK